MVNCNPETVSTDYDTSDRLFFEPLTGEDVLAICDDARRARRARRRDRQPRRADAAEARPHARRRRRPDPGDEPGVDRPRRGPRALQRAVHPARHPATRRRHGGVAGRRAVPSPTRVGYPVLVRPSYVLGGRAMQIVYDADGLDAAMAELASSGSLGREGGLERDAPRAHRPVPRGRDRGRRRRPPRRRRRGRHRRGHGAHRGGRRAFRRLGVRDPAPDARGARDRDHRGAHPRARRRARRPRAPQRPVRGEGRRGLRDRGQPAGQPHGPVRQQGDRRAAGEAGGPGDARHDARPAPGRRSSTPGARSKQRQPRRGEGGGAAVRALSRGRHPARARDALDRRGHGHRPLVRARVHQEPGGGRQPVARARHRVLLARRPRQALRAGRRPPARRPRVLAGGHGRHRRRAAGQRHSGRRDRREARRERRIRRRTRSSSSRPARWIS